MNVEDFPANFVDICVPEVEHIRSVNYCCPVTRFDWRRAVVTGCSKLSVTFSEKAVELVGG